MSVEALEFRKIEVREIERRANILEKLDEKGAEIKKEIHETKKYVRLPV